MKLFKRSSKNKKKKRSHSQVLTSRRRSSFKQTSEPIDDSRAKVSRVKFEPIEVVEIKHKRKNDFQNFKRLATYESAKID
jgi:hypothetical protein